MKRRSRKEDEALRQRAELLRLHGLLASWEEFGAEPWVPGLIEAEEKERNLRSLKRRTQQARLGRFKPMADFDWSWPEAIDREQVEDILALGPMREGVNVIFRGTNGGGKTMLAKNIGNEALIAGYTVRFVTASVLLGELAAHETAQGLQRAMTRFVRPKLLIIDELGYLSYGNRHADLLFDLITRRDDAGGRSLVLTTNRAFRDWDQTFPNATCVVTLVDRLVHRSEIVEIKAKSYRLKEAEERKTVKARERRARREKAQTKQG